MSTNFRLYFLVPYLLLLVFGFGYWLMHEHGDYVLLLNESHTPTGDFFFKYITHFGDGYLLAAVIAVVLILNWRAGLVFGAIGIGHSIISGVLKRVVFEGTPRPKTYFEDADFLNYVAGVSVHGFNAFPSGHTMTAFALATFVSLYFDKKWLTGTMFVLAVFAGISRVYLLQHFLIDILVGSMIGVVVTATTFYYTQEYINKGRNLTH